MKNPQYSDPVMLIGDLNDLWKQGILPPACDPYFEWKLKGGPMFPLETGYLLLIETSRRIRLTAPGIPGQQSSPQEASGRKIFEYINDEVKTHLPLLK